MKKELIERLQAVGPRVRAAIEGLAPAELDLRPIDGKWSTRECLEHIVLVDLGWTDILYEAVCPHHPEVKQHVKGWSDAAQKQVKQSIEDAFDVLDRNHAEVIAFLQQLPEACFDKEYPPVQWLVYTKAPFVIKDGVNWGLNLHVDHHLAHVHDKRVALGKPLAWMADLKKCC